MFLIKLRHTEGFSLAGWLPARAYVGSGRKQDNVAVGGGGEGKGGVKTTCSDSSFTGVELSEAAVHQYLRWHLWGAAASCLNGKTHGNFFKRGKGLVSRSGGTKSEGEKQGEQAHLLWKGCLWQTVKPSYKLIMSTFALEKLKCQSFFTVAVL